MQEVKHRWRGSRKWFVVGYFGLATLIWVVMDPTALRSTMLALLFFAFIGLVFYFEHQDKKESRA